MATAYKFYRILFKKNSSGDLRYYAVNTLNLYTSADGSGLDVAPSGVVTANGSYSATTTPDKAIDGDPATYFESSNRVTAGSDGWLQLEFPYALVIRSLRIISTAYVTEYPRDFLFQGSADGVNWVTVASFVDFMVTGGATTRLVPTLLQVRGTSKLESGVASNRVLIHNWTTGALIRSITPEADGSFFYMATDTTTQVMVTHIGPSGFRPICDGPITPSEV